MTRNEIKKLIGCVRKIDKIDFLKTLEHKDDYRVFIKVQDGQVVDVTEIMDDGISEMVLKSLDETRERAVEYLSHFHCDLSDPVNNSPLEDDKDIV